MVLWIGVFMIHGVIPGPFILKKQPQIFGGIMTSIYVGNIILLILSIPLIKCSVRIMDVPIPCLSPLLKNLLKRQGREPALHKKL